MYQITTEPSLKWKLLRIHPLQTILFVSGFLLVLMSVLALVAWDRKEEIPSAAGAAVICLVVAWFTTNWLSIPREDKDWLVTLVLTGFVIRVIVSLTIYYTLPDPYYLGEDQPGYDYLPTLLLRYWEGTGPRPEAVFRTEGGSRLGYFGFVAIQYYTLGISYLVPRVFNCLAGAMVCSYAYRIGRLVFGRDVGKVAALWAAFFPSLILWSALNLRDIWLTLAILVITWHALLLRERVSFNSIFIIVLCLVWIEYNRAYLVPIMVLVAAGTFVFARSRDFVKDIFILAAFLMLVFGLYYFFDFGKTVTDYVDLTKVSEYREKMTRTTTGRSGYLPGIDLTNPVVLVLFAPLGLLYFLFAPFPWQISGIRQVITLPEMLAWYWCIPFVIRAFWQVGRDRTRRGQALLLPLAAISIAYAISSGNVGTAYRHRAQIITFYLVFAAAGFMNWKMRRAVGRKRVRMPVHKMTAQTGSLDSGRL